MSKNARRKSNQSWVSKIYIITGDEDVEHEMNAGCREKFKQIEESLKEGAEDMQKHSLDIVEMKTDVKSITKSLDGVTKALWGMAAAILMALLGFMLSKI